MAQSPIIQERGRFRRDTGFYPATNSEPRSVSPQTWVILAFALSIPVAVATYWAATTENWSVLAPILILMGIAEVGLLAWTRRDD